MTPTICPRCGYAATQRRAIRSSYDAPKCPELVAWCPVCAVWLVLQPAGIDEDGVLHEERLVPLEGDAK